VRESIFAMACSTAPRLVGRAVGAGWSWSSCSYGEERSRWRRMLSHGPLRRHGRRRWDTARGLRCSKHTIADVSLAAADRHYAVTKLLSGPADLGNGCCRHGPFTLTEG